MRKIAALDLSISKGLQRYYGNNIFNAYDVQDGDPSEFLRLQKEYDQAMPPKLQEIVKLLNQVRDKILGQPDPVYPIENTTDRLSPSIGTRLVRTFPMPEGSTWADVEIRFTSDFEAQISVAGRTEVRTYIEMGFEDGRKGKQNPKPDQNWEVLRTFAQRDGAFGSTKEAYKWPKIEKRVQAINTRLKKLFGFSEKTIKYDRKARAYKTKVRLVPPPSNETR